MALVGDDLRRHVLRSAAEGPGHLPLLQLPGEPEVSKLHVARRVQEEILWLQVTVDDPLGVEVIKGQDDTGNIESCLAV